MDQFDALDLDIKEEGLRRLEICNACPMRSGDSCDPNKKGTAVSDFYYPYLREYRKEGQEYTGCGCNIQAKTVCPDCVCPLNKWNNARQTHDAT